MPQPAYQRYSLNCDWSPLQELVERSMPWSPSDGPSRHTKKASSPKKKRQWAHVANEVLSRTGDEGRAVREANAAVKRNKEGKKR